MLIVNEEREKNIKVFIACLWWQGINILKMVLSEYFELYLECTLQLHDPDRIISVFLKDDNYLFLLFKLLY